MGARFSSRDRRNPDNRFEPVSIEWEEGYAQTQALRFREEQARTILTENDSPDIPFRYSVNPYRGCTHACAYCYARPTHEYLGLGAGTDFDTQIQVKVNAPELLRKRFASKSWKKEVVVFSGITDCYQPAENRFRLTRQCLEVCLEAANPVSIITKSNLILRDLDVLRALLGKAGVTVTFSIPFLDATIARAMEPFAPPPEVRFKALQTLAECGIPTGISLGPVIPGLNDAHIPELLRRAKAGGARFAFYVMLRLPGAVRGIFLERLKRELPEVAGKVAHHLSEVRGGKGNDARFGSRMTGEGKMAEMVAKVFELHCRKLGLEMSEDKALYEMRLPAAGGGTEDAIQMGLFNV